MDKEAEVKRTTFKEAQMAETNIGGAMPPENETNPVVSTRIQAGDSAFGQVDVSKPEKGHLPIPTPESSERHPQYDMFVQTIADLRSPKGCPWDLQQTHKSIAKNMLEEAYEAVAAIEEDDPDHLCEELGDVLLEVVLQAQIAQDAGEFNIEDVARGINEKMWRRHPHVYGSQAAFQAAGLDPVLAAEDADEVNELWNLVKSYERQLKDAARSEKLKAAGLDPDTPRGLMEDVPRQLPA